MRPFVTDGVGWSVSLSARLSSVSVVSLQKTAEPNEMPFGLWTRVGARKHVLDGGAHWCHLANTIEPSMCSGNAVFLSNYFDHLLCNFDVEVLRKVQLFWI